YFTECLSQLRRFQQVAKMPDFVFTVCPVWPLRYLPPGGLERAMGIETVPAVTLCVFTRVSATVKRTKAHRTPCQLLQTATTSHPMRNWRYWQVVTACRYGLPDEPPHTQFRKEADDPIARSSPLHVTAKVSADYLVA